MQREKGVGGVDIVDESFVHGGLRRVERITKLALELIPSLLLIDVVTSRGAEHALDGVEKFHKQAFDAQREIHLLKADDARSIRRGDWGEFHRIAPLVKQE